MPLGFRHRGSQADLSITDAAAFPALKTAVTYRPIFFSVSRPSSKRHRTSASGLQALCHPIILDLRDAMNSPKVCL